MVVRERHPLKQGLKQTVCDSSGALPIVRERHPLKQGLKLPRVYRRFMARGVRERHPLKQGLKRKIRATNQLPHSS